MQSVKYLCVTALAVGWSATALAQTSAPSPPPASTQATMVGPIDTHWIASGFVGSNLGAESDNASVRSHGSFDFGGEIAYMWNGYIGAEFIGAFDPSFKVTSPLLPDNSRVGTYMGNAIAGLPVGSGGQFQPYLSGGFGGISMRAHIVTDLIGNTTDNTQTTWGWNAGVGVNGFAGKWGFRADGRYYRAPQKDNLSGSLEDALTQSLLSSLHFWRASIGVAYRW
jgi:opacity protein-like surface antigen